MNELLRRLARRIWIETGSVHNPWFSLAASPSLSHQANQAKWERWNQDQLALTRELFSVVFHDVEPTEELLTRALDFLDGR